MRRLWEITFIVQLGGQTNDGYPFVKLDIDWRNRYRTILECASVLLSSPRVGSQDYSRPDGPSGPAFQFVYCRELDTVHSSAACFTPEELVIPIPA